MTFVSLFVFGVALAFQLVSVAPSDAQSRPVDRPVVNVETNERGFTLGDMVDGKLWAVARHPLSPAAFSQIGESVHHTPKRGIQFELLTPGDIGATLHLYW